MKSKNWKDSAELLGVAAIVGSLIFVGLQMRQTQEIAIGDAYQARAEMLLQVQSMFFDSDTLPNIIDKVRGGESLDEMEAAHLWRYQLVWIAYHENNYFQYRSGLLSVDHWTGSRIALKRRIASNSVFQDRWPGTRETFSKPFVGLVEELIAEIKAERNSREAS